MTKTSTPEELAAALSFFPPGAVKAMQRLLRRAAALAEAAARKDVTRLPGHSGAGLGIAMAPSLAAQISKVMRQRGASKGPPPTLKRKAPGPDGGGRSFHFAHTTVGRSSPSAGRGTPTGSARKRGGSDVPGKAAKHMAYIERGSAIERIAAVTPEQDGRSLARGGGRELDRGEGDTAERGQADHGAAAAGQGYIENAAKVARDEEIIASFGTIGATHAERLQFWEELEAHEPHPDARIQNRLIIELPYEASPAMRMEMVREFCRQQFEARGLPFWAALHVPGKKNDARNYHVHIVFSERPAQRMLDELDGVEKWDFSIVRTKRKASGNVMRQHPHRQKKDDFLRKKNAIPKLRANFAEIANTVLKREQVKDRAGEPVLYDPRSYKDMGIDVLPVRSLNRIVADKVKAGKLTVLDRDYNRGLLQAELQDAAARRDKGLLELVRMEEAVSALARTPGRAKGINRLLPSEMRVSLARPLTSSAVRSAGKAVLTAKRIALSEEVMARSVRSALERVVEAGDPVVIASSHAHTRDAKQAFELPDVEAARLLHAAARQELTQFDNEAAYTKRRAKARTAAALKVWQDTVGPDLSSTSPAMQAALSAARMAPGMAVVEPVAQVRQADRVEVQPGKDLKRPAGRENVTPAAKHADAQMPPVGSPEYNARVRHAFAATSAVIAAIGRFPHLEDRLRILDALPAALNRARAERLAASDREATVAPEPMAARSGPPIEATPSKAAPKDTSAEPVSDVPAAVETGPTHELTPDPARLRSEVDEERKKKKRRKRRAVMARRNDDRGR